MPNSLDPAQERELARRSILEAADFNMQVQRLKSFERIQSDQWAAFAILHPTNVIWFFNGTAFNRKPGTSSLNHRKHGGWSAPLTLAKCDQHCDCSRIGERHALVL